MMTVHKVSELTGVSIRALHIYDRMGLLPATQKTGSGYRLYDDTALEKLQQILLFRELGFPLKDIKGIIDSPAFDRNKALEQQITLLQMKKEHIENLIDLAQGLKIIGVKHMSFEAFDTRKIDEYARQAKASWGTSPEWKEFEQKSAGRTAEDNRNLHYRMMAIFSEFGQIRAQDPAGMEAQKLVKKLQNFITENLYTCSDKILLSLGRMYAGGGSMTEGIDKAGGEGTGEFAFRAIEAYVAARQ